MNKITPTLWFDGQAAEAADFYISVFGEGRVLELSRYPDDGRGQPGKVLTVIFEVAGQRFVGLNGGPDFKFNEAVSFTIDCADQDEVDHFWNRLTEGGEASRCGWLKDRFGVSWQVVPRVLPQLLSGGGDPQRAGRAMTAMLGMSKLDIAALERAADGDGAD